MSPPPDVSVRRTLFALALLVAGCAACGGEHSTDGPAGAAAPVGFNGRFSAQGAQGPMVLDLVERDGVVTATMNGDSTKGRLVAPGRVEGSEETEAGTGTFVFRLEGDELVANFRVPVPGGETIEVPELRFRRVVSTPSPAGGETRNSALAGHWRHTEARASGGFTMATDVHLVLGADGSYESWSQSASSFGSSRGESTRGRWRTSGDALEVQSEGGSGWSSLGRFQASGEHLLLIRASGDRVIYERL